MALFKIEKGRSDSLPIARPNTTEGWCYFTTDDGKFYIDIDTKQGDTSGRIALNAAHADTATEANHANAANVATEANHASAADSATEANHASTADSATEASKLATQNVGSADTPVYFKDGVPVACEDIKAGDYLPLTAGEDFKLIGPLGLTENIMYGPEFPENPFEGQLFFLEGGTASGDVVSLPKGGNRGTILFKNSNEDGDAVWSDNIMHISDQGIDIGVPLSADSGIYSDGDINTTCSITAADDITATNFIAENIISGEELSVSQIYCGGNVEVNGLSVFKADVEVEGNLYGAKVYGAVWNDYAEYRDQNEMIEPGYCVASADNGRIYKTTEKFQACDGIVSDTFGFAIGETENNKTPLAVAGRVLAYCEGNRYDYHAGDTVCAGPDGKVVKMSREEIREWPDRIVGIVSEIPEYETWGTDNVPVNGRIWIKVK